VQPIEDKTVLIVGLGLIGGSVARGLASVRGCRRILACGRDEGALQTALLDGSIHGYSTDLATIAPQADLIVIATPTLSVAGILEQLRTCAREDAVITDAASVKASVVDEARHILGAGLRRFVAGHPIAGSEQSGYAASRADLYRQRKVILTPVVENDAAALQLVMRMWQLLGADVHVMSAHRHDRILAGTSHLPHLLAYTLVNTLAESVGEPDRPQQVFDYAAGGFADFSRVASSDPVMWRDIFLSNRDATVAVLDSYVEALGRMKTLLLRSDGAALQECFTQSKATRDDFIRRFKAGESSLTERAVVLSDELRVSPSVLLSGACCLRAHPETAAQALDDMMAIGGVWEVRGMPEDKATLRALQVLREAAVPVSGPEDGQLLLFATSAHAARPQVRQLPADAFLLGVLALMVAALPGSSVVLPDALPASSPLPPLINALRGLGLRVEHRAATLELLHPGRQLQGGARLDVPAEGVSEAECLVLIAAGLCCDSPVQIALPVARYHSILPRLSLWQRCCPGLTVAEELIVVDPGADFRLAGRLECGQDTEIALLTAMLAAAGDTPVVLAEAGDIRDRYPGLVAQLRRLGMQIEVGG